MMSRGSVVSPADLAAATKACVVESFADQRLGSLSRKSASRHRRQRHSPPAVPRTDAMPMTSADCAGMARALGAGCEASASAAALAGTGAPTVAPTGTGAPAGTGASTSAGALAGAGAPLGAASRAQAPMEAGGAAGGGEGSAPGATQPGTDGQRLFTLEASVAPDDCCDAAFKLHNMRSRGDPLVCVLNMASQRNPGGGYKNGAAAQEEYLCRVSTLSACVEGARSEYPLPSYGGLYCPAVTVFRHAENDAYRRRETPFRVAVACCAAVNRPATIHVPVAAEAGVGSGGSGGSGATGARATDPRPYVVRLEPREETEVRQRIVAMLEMCRTHGHVDLVLGAWGCGAFRNPPEHVAQIFHQVLRSARFQHAFRRVVFAVWDPPQARFPNFRRFARAWKAETKAYRARVEAANSKARGRKRRSRQ